MCVGNIKRSLIKLFGGGDDKEATVVEPPPLPAAPKAAPTRQDSGVKARRVTEVNKLKALAGTASQNATSTQGLTGAANTKRKKLLG